MRLILTLLFALPILARPAFAAEPAAQLVTFPSPHGELKGFLYEPEGTGRHPAILWNHGSEKLPGQQAELAHFYTAHGFVFFIPHRAGQGRSPGTYIVDIIRADPSKAISAQEDANQDVAAAAAWLRTRSSVDPDRLIISGCSFGGIQTLLSAEKGLGARAYIAFAPAAMSWRNTTLQARMKQAVAGAKAPVFILQARNDYNLGPSETLGPIAEAHGGKVKTYPAFGISNQEGHGAFATKTAGTAIWGDDVLKFIDAAFRKPLLAGR